MRESTVPFCSEDLTYGTINVYYDYDSVTSIYGDAMDDIICPMNSDSSRDFSWMSASFTLNRPVLLSAIRVQVEVFNPPALFTTFSFGVDGRSVRTGPQDLLSTDNVFVFNLTTPTCISALGLDAIPEYDDVPNIAFRNMELLVYVP